MIARFFLENWQQKLLALIAALVLWVFVNHSIIATKTIPNIPVRITNLQEDKTIRGLLPNGILDRRMTLTMSGSKDVIEDLEPGDLEVLLDVSTAESTESGQWNVNVTKKNLISLNPSIDLTHHITQVDHSVFLIKLSELLTAKVPVQISVIADQAPPEFQFLDVWPQLLEQTVSGPKEDVERLQVAGLEMMLDLKNLKVEDLAAQVSANSNSSNDEISFLVPNKWKKVAIPFLRYDQEQLNDPNAQFLRIDFLKKQLLPIEGTIPTRVFYPQEYLTAVNPNSHPLATSHLIKDEHGITVFDYPIYARNVGRLFLEVIRDSIEIMIIAAPREERDFLHWNVEIHDPDQLEDTYVAYLISILRESDDSDQQIMTRDREQLLRERFRTYRRQFRLFTKNDQKFRLRSRVEENQIKVTTLEKGFS